MEMHENPASPALLENSQLELLHKPISVAEYREYYHRVGEKYFWLDRLVMPDEELFQKINNENIDIYIFKMNNEAAGFIEYILDKDYTEVLYFGLFPEFIGKGYGKYFLEIAIEKAWSYDPTWIQLNTCTLDHPNALPNYLKAGFKIVKTEIHQRRVIP